MIRFLSINSARPLADGSVDPTYTEGRGRRSGSGKKTTSTFPLLLHWEAGYRPCEKEGVDDLDTLRGRPHKNSPFGMPRDQDGGRLFLSGHGVCLKCPALLLRSTQPTFFIIVAGICSLDVRSEKKMRGAATTAVTPEIQGPISLWRDPSQFEGPTVAPPLFPTEQTSLHGLL